MPWKTSSKKSMRICIIVPPQITDSSGVLSGFIVPED
jgi:hypothetical protein